MIQWRKFLVLVVFMMAWVPLSQASWDEARDVVEGATQEMVSLLADPALKDEAAFPELFNGVDQLLAPKVDFSRIARGVMAKHYRSATDEQREKFSKVFKNTLVKTYAKALAVFDFDRYKIVPNRTPSKKPTKQTVMVDVFAADGTRYKLTYYVLKGKNGWKVTNMHLDGINLRQIFKNQFADAVSNNKGNLDKVIDDWSRLADDKVATKES